MLLTWILLPVLTLLSPSVHGSSWGKQSAVLSKNAASLRATQSGSRNTGQVQASAKDPKNVNLFYKGKSYKAAKFSNNKVGAGLGNTNANEAGRQGVSSWGAKSYKGERANVKTKGRTEADVNARGKTVKNKVGASGFYKTAEANLGSNKKYTAQFAEGTKQFLVKDDKGKVVADGKIQGKGGRNYNVMAKYGGTNINAGNRQMGRNGEGIVTIQGGKVRSPQKFSSKTKDGTRTRTEIYKNGGVFGKPQGATEVDTARKAVKLEGPLLKNNRVSMMDRGQRSQYCPKPSRGPAYQWNDGRYKIDTKNIKLMPPQKDQRGGNLKVSWPQCVTLEVPMTFPPGTKIEYLAVSLKVAIPGCNQLLCAGYVCGNEATAPLGTAQETCWEDNLCQYNVNNNPQGSIIGAALKNSKSDACKSGYNGGPLRVKTTFCAMDEKKMKKTKHCSFVNLRELFDQTAGDRSQIMVIATVYEKRDKSKSNGALGQLTSLLKNGLGNSISKVLTGCNKSEYDAKGCYELAQDYQMTAFGMNENTHSYMKSGVNRGSTGTRGSSGGGSQPRPPPRRGNRRWSTPAPRPSGTTQPFWRRWFGNNNQG